MLKRLNRKWALSSGFVLFFGALFVRSLDNFPFHHIAGTLTGLQVWQIGFLLWFNILIFLLFSSRWWLALRALGHNVSYLALSGYRLVAFGISYFTPGPQIGGEPAQVHLLHKRQAVPVEDALASISFDKLIEFLANFSFLAVGSGVALQSGFFPGSGPYKWLVWVVFLLLLPLMYLVGLSLGARPLGFLLGGIQHKLKVVGSIQKGIGAVQIAETQVSEFCIRQPKMVFTSCAVSLLIWVLSVAEYGLTLRFLGASLSLEQILIALTAARLAFLTPLPGGLGALEAGQVFALNAMGYDPSLGISVAIVIRVRDVLLGSAGLGWGSLLSIRRFRLPAASPAGD